MCKHLAFYFFGRRLYVEEICPFVEFMQPQMPHIATFVSEMSHRDNDRANLFTFLNYKDMKKFLFLLTCLTVMTFGLAGNAAAQDVQKSPFLGTWSMELDTPMGLMPMDVTFSVKDGKIEGVCTGEGTQDNVELYDVVWDGKKHIDFGMFSQGYDVPFTVDLQDDGTLKGTAMNGMLSVTGKKKEAAGTAQ